MASVPGRKQYATMLALGAGGAGMSRSHRQVAPMIHHGWVSGEWDGRFFHFVRLTPGGYRALADAVELYGLPELRKPPEQEGGGD